MPKFIISKFKVIEQYKKIKAISDVVSYSSKTNPIITDILEKETDSNFSIHIQNELKHVKDKSRIFFLAQGWTNNQIKELVSQKITSFVVDNESDLNTLIEFINKNNVEINLLLRIKLKERSIKTERYFVFGMDSEIVNKKIRELKNNKNIKQIGIHFHRKSQNMSEWNLRYEFNEMIDNENLKLLDAVCIGGGLPSEYANTNVDVIKGIFEKIKDFKKFLNENKIKLIVEPGRFIAAPSVKLETEIINVYENNIVVNASVYNSDMDAIIVPVKLLVEGELEKGQSYVIKGITPCSMDLFRYKVYLKNPKKGDKIVFLNAGAYNFSSDFCDLEKIESVIVE